jgi:hypothetical protein
MAIPGKAIQKQHHANREIPRRTRDKFGGPGNGKFNGKSARLKGGRYKVKS